MQFDLGAKNREESLVFPWFLHKVSSPSPHGLNRQFDIGPCGHHDHGNGGVKGHNLREQIETFLSGSGIPRVVEVDEHCIIRTTGESFAHERRRTNFVYFVALRPEQQLQGFQDVLLVISGENPGRRA